MASETPLELGLSPLLCSGVDDELLPPESPLCGAWLLEEGVEWDCADASRAGEGAGGAQQGRTSPQKPGDCEPAPDRAAAGHPLGAALASAERPDFLLDLALFDELSADLDLVHGALQGALSSPSFGASSPEGPALNGEGSEGGGVPGGVPGEPGCKEGWGASGLTAVWDVGPTLGKVGLGEACPWGAPASSTASQAAEMALQQPAPFFSESAQPAPPGPIQSSCGAPSSAAQPPLCASAIDPAAPAAAREAAEEASRIGALLARAALPGEDQLLQGCCSSGTPFAVGVDIPFGSFDEACAEERLKQSAAGATVPQGITSTGTCCALRVEQRPSEAASRKEQDRAAPGAHGDEAGFCVRDSPAGPGPAAGHHEESPMATSWGSRPLQCGQHILQGLSARWGQERGSMAHPTMGVKDTIRRDTALADVSSFTLICGPNDVTMSAAAPAPEAIWLPHVHTSPPSPRWAMPLRTAGAPQRGLLAELGAPQCTKSDADVSDPGADVSTGTPLEEGKAGRSTSAKGQQVTQNLGAALHAIKAERKPAGGASPNPRSLGSLLAAALDHIESAGRASSAASQEKATGKRPAESEAWALLQPANAASNRSLKASRYTMSMPSFGSDSRAARAAGAVLNMVARAAIGQRVLGSNCSISYVGIVPSRAWRTLAQRVEASSAVALPQDGRMLSAMVPSSSEEAASDATAMALRAKLLMAAEAVEQGDQKRFRAIQGHLQAFAKPKGNALERVALSVLTALVHRSQGTGFAHANAPTKHTLQELEDARAWYYTECPACPFAGISSVGALVPKLMGKTDVHIIDIGEIMLPQWPAVMKLLAQKPQLPALTDLRSGSPQPTMPTQGSAGGISDGGQASGGALKRLRITQIQLHGLTYPGREDVNSMLRAPMIAQHLEKVGRSLHIEVKYERLELSHDSMGLLRGLARQPGETLAVVSAFLQKFLSMEAGTLPQMMECLQRLKPEVVSLTEECVDGSAPSVVERVNALLDYVLPTFLGHDALVQGRRKKLLHVWEKEYFGTFVIAPVVACDEQKRCIRPLSCSGYLEAFKAYRFEPVPVQPSTIAALQDMVACFPKGYSIVNANGIPCVTWQGQPLAFTSSFALA